MKKYEYKVEEIHAEHNCEYWLNQWAKQGWRLVAVVPFIDSKSDDRGYSHSTQKIRYILEADHAE